MGDKSKIISLVDVIESKILKESELEYYYNQIKEINRKIVYLEADLNITKTIIKMIESETVIEVENIVPLINIDGDNNGEEED